MANKRKISATVLFSLLAACAFAQTATTDPVGFVRKDAAPGYLGLGVPLIISEPFVGAVSSNTGSVVTFSGTGLNVGSTLDAAKPYFLEVLSGPLEGERIDVSVSATVSAANATVSLNLASANNTVTTVAANALATARCAIREHLTIQRLQGLFSPVLTGNNNPDLADKVYLYEGGWVRYNLRGDNVTWRKQLDTVNNYATKVIPPGAGFMVQFVGSTKTMVNVGKVRTNAFRYNLATGLQAFALPFPVNMSPVEVGGFVDANDPAGIRWVGNNNAAAADQLLPYDGGFVRYNLRSDGVTWRKQLDTTNDYANNRFLAPDNVTMIKRTNADSGYLVIRPFSL